MGVILTGNLDDCTVGLVVVKALGSLAVIQDRMSAVCPSMPRSAIAHVEPDYLLRPGEIGHLLARLCRLPIGEERIQLYARGKEMLQNQTTTRSSLTCPECNGSLVEPELDGVIEFQCHVGHVFSLESMIAEQADQVKAALPGGERGARHARGEHVAP